MTIKEMVTIYRRSSKVSCQQVVNGRNVVIIHFSRIFLGQNKHRMKETRQQPTERICPFIIHEENCPFGEGCRHLHDVTGFTINRNADIGPECYIYRTFGRCPQGMSCRYKVMMRDLILGAQTR